MAVRHTYVKCKVVQKLIYVRFYSDLMCEECIISKLCHCQLKPNKGNHEICKIYASKLPHKK